MSRNGGNDEAKRSFRNSMITTCLPVDGDISGELDIIRGTVTVPV